MTFDPNKSLVDAVLMGKVELVQALLTRGADLGEKKKDGRTPLIMAAHTGQMDIVKLLLKSDAPLDEKDREGKTALWHAARYQREEIFCLLVEKGANISEEGLDTARSWLTFQKMSKALQVLDSAPEKRRQAILEKSVQMSAGPLQKKVPVPKVLQFKP